VPEKPEEHPASLGNDGMGSVRLAVDCTLHRPVALKELPGFREVRDAHHLAVLREARATCAVVHPGVVRVYGVLRDAGQDRIVVEALSGTTLAEATRQDGPLPYERVVDIGLRLLETSAAIHDEGVIHGELNPATST